MVLKASYLKIFDEAKETPTFLLPNDLKQNEKISKIGDFSNIIILKVGNNIL